MTAALATCLEGVFGGDECENGTFLSARKCISIKVYVWVVVRISKGVINRLLRVSVFRG